MVTTKYRIDQMDCDAEEQLVRLALADLTGVSVGEVDLTERSVIVEHEGDASLVTAALDALDLGTTVIEEAPATDGPRRRTEHSTERSVLLIALAINAAFFFGEMVAGLLSRSIGLVADSLDMLADASVYGLSLLAVGGNVARKKRLAAASGYLQFGLAVIGVAEVVRRFITSEGLPEFRTMIGVSSLALAGNVVTLLILRRARSPEVHFQASWIFTANDIKVNALVIVAAIAVAISGSAAPDLIAGAAIFVIVDRGARRILALAR